MPLAADTLAVNHFLRLLTAFVLLLLAACGGGQRGPTNPSGNNPYGVTLTGPGVLSVSPIDPALVFAASPLGKLGPPDHTLPTDHVYITFVDAFGGNQQNNVCDRFPIYAAGAGVVDFVLVTESRGDTKVDVQMTQTFHYYYDHVLLLSGIAPGTHVTAGQQIGTTNGLCPSFDLGTYDLGVNLPGLINQARYGDSTRHTVSPYQYFAEPLRSFYYAHSRVLEGVPGNRDGRIDYGVAGRLVGDWFHSSQPADASSSGSSAGWSKSIAFAYDWYDGRPRISVGGTIASPFLGLIGAADPDPVTVSIADGLVAYQITRPGAFETYGWLLVQMTAADHIRVEFFLGATSRPAAFTGSAQEYLR
jgi:hypothetical protein